jgi:hypothetical protein
MNPNLVSDQLPEGSPEREYHQALANVLLNMHFDPKDADMGFGLLDFLCTHGFDAVGVDTKRHPAAGSIEENAWFVAQVFHSVNRDPIWWKARYPIESSRPQVVAQKQRWLSMFKASREVRSVV